MVIIDQDGAGPGGTDQMAMMLLLQSPQAKRAGNHWPGHRRCMGSRKRCNIHYYMLELIRRTDVPVVPGAIFPLVRTEQGTKLQQSLYGSSSYYGVWQNLAPGSANRKPSHGPYVVPKLVEGDPAIKPSAEDAAHFLIRQVHAHPHDVTIYAAGPLTNIALAISIDPHFDGHYEEHAVIASGTPARPAKPGDAEFVNADPRREFQLLVRS